MTRAEDLARDAAIKGYQVCAYSPGDGVTRYRFFVKAEVPTGQDYFGPKNGCYTALGLKEARMFVDLVEEAAS